MKQNAGMPLPLPAAVDRAELTRQPIERAETIPSNWYHDPEVLDFENRAIFSGYWQLVCHEDQLSEPGDIYTTEVAGNPILIVRDRDRKLHAFYNVCRHRGGPLAVKKGSTSVLQCRYHGWTYLLDGSLRGVPQWDRVDLFDKKDFGLLPVRLEVWEGLVFINLSEDRAGIDRFVEGIAARISPIDLSAYSFHTEVSYDINCNWKVYVDNFLEGYHIPIVHPGLAKLLDYRQYVTETSGWYSLQHSAIRSNGGNSPYGDEGEAYYYFIFPNIMLNILPGRLQTNVVKPAGPSNTEVLFSYYYADAGNGTTADVIREDLSYSDAIQQEDIEICEAVQKGVESSSYDKGRFSVEREEGVYHFQCLLKQAYAEAVSGG